jgi:hypothetical protein
MLTKFFRLVACKSSRQQRSASAQRRFSGSTSATSSTPACALEEDAPPLVASAAHTSQAQRNFGPFTFLSTTMQGMSVI